MSNKKGFTLIEILVVVFIIALLASIIIVSVNRARITSRDARRKADLAAVKTAVELYFDLRSDYRIKTPPPASLDTGAIGWPSSGWFNASGGSYQVNSTAHGLELNGLLNPAPKDPISNGYGVGSYQYMYYTDGNKYSVYTRLENPDCTAPCWDSHSTQTEANPGLNATLKATYLMNYRVGNGY